ncbi:hypothetical protein HED52_03500 [Ochrobactrum ciceri]|uniref:Uncharacterized protein n=1 Tax=Brucella ciceri TaxID=391287 RepID=A0ABX1DS65_9HYPH|nr:hypothetical protein [Brucella ciceri]
MTYVIKITPRSEREAMIEKRLAASSEFGETIFDFRSGTFTPKVISLPIAVPLYRMENCRTFSAQQTEIAREGLDKDYFAKGQELTTVQQSQHEILIKLAKQGSGSVTPIINVLDQDGQREPILISSSGIVVNGNRRLSAMRELMRKMMVLSTNVLRTFDALFYPQIFHVMKSTTSKLIFKPVLRQSWITTG